MVQHPKDPWRNLHPFTWDDIYIVCVSSGCPASQKPPASDLTIAMVQFCPTMSHWVCCEARNVSKQSGPNVPCQCGKLHYLSLRWCRISPISYLQISVQCKSNHHEQKRFRAATRRTTPRRLFCIVAGRRVDGAIKAPLFSYSGVMPRT